MQIIRYTSEYKESWDSFVKISKNGHFFFQRNFMEYHKDRFKDFSLLIKNEKQNIIALLPANKEDNTIHSHQGLTFGGFIVDDNMKTETMLKIFESLVFFLKEQSIHKLIYKCIPHIYHTKPAEEDKYALFRNNAKLIARNVTTTIFLENKIKYQERRKRAIKKAIKNDLIFEESKDFKSFWLILKESLHKHHNAKPIHTIEEIEKLVSLFPNNIKLFVAKKKNEIMSGAIVFENEHIVHTQYLTNSSEGKKEGGLDLVIDKLINEVYKSKKSFDLGTSNEDAGKYLNLGLMSQKEGFGARAIVHDFYELQIT